MEQRERGREGERARERERARARCGRDLERASQRGLQAAVGRASASSLWRGWEETGGIAISVSPNPLSGHLLMPPVRFSPER